VMGYGIGYIHQLTSGIFKQIQSNYSGGTHYDLISLR